MTQSLVDVDQASIQEEYALKLQELKTAITNARQKKELEQLAQLDIANELKLAQMPRQTLEVGQLALQIMEECERHEQCAELYIKMAEILGDLGRSSETIRYYSRGLHLISKTADLNKVLDVKLNLAIRMGQAGELEIAEEKLLEVDDEARRNQVLHWSRMARVNLVNIYLIKDKTNLAKATLDELKAFGLDNMSKGGAYSILSNLGVCHDRLGEHETAEKYFKQALDHCTNNGMSRGIANAMSTLGEFYDRQGRYQEGIEVCLQLIHYCERRSYRRRLLDAYDQISLLYEKTNDIEFALKYIKEFRYLNKEILGDHANDAKSALQEQEALRNLQEANEELVTFNHNVAHDLKAPLRNINTYIHVLKSKGLVHEASQELVDHIATNATSMTNMIDDLLKLSLVGKESVAKIPVDLTRLMAEIKPLLVDSAPKANAQIEVAGVMPTILGGETRVKQLFQNLISNGLKYNKHDSPRVEITCEDKYENYLFVIKDNGIGIPQNQLDHVFKIFYRSSNADQYEGSGIGLSICHKIVRDAGGLIWVESEENKGSTFKFTWPKYRG